MAGTGYTKYYAKKTVVDGITFDSKKEAERYKELKAMEERGEVYNLELQRKFELLPSFVADGKKFRAITYKADFAYFTFDGQPVVEDVKGFKTEVYKIKAKLFAYKYHFQITEI